MFATVIAAAAAFAASINLTTLAVVVALAMVYIPLFAMNRQRLVAWTLSKFTIRQSMWLAGSALALSFIYIAVVWYFSNWQTVVVWVVIEYYFNMIVAKVIAKRDEVVLA